MNVVTPLPAVNSFLGRVGAAVSSARHSLLNAQRRMNKDADQARRDEQLSVDKYVLLSTKSLRLFHVDRQKMLSKYLGPFVVQSGRVLWHMNYACLHQ